MTPNHVPPPATTKSSAQPRKPERSSRRSHSSWSGPLLNLLRATPSSAPDQNALVFPTRPGTPVREALYKSPESPHPLQKASSRTPLLSKTNTMPVSPSPYPQDPLPNPKYEVYSTGRDKYQRHKHSASASSSQSFYRFPPQHCHSNSASLSHLAAYPTVFERDRNYSTSSAHAQAPPSFHRRSRSESFSLPNQVHTENARNIVTPIPSSLVHDSISSRGRPRSNSFSQPQSVRRRKSSLRMRRSRSRSFKSQVESTFRQEPRHVQFILPATLHLYLHEPPFNVVIERPPPPGLAAYYYPYMSQPATKPSVAFMLITTPYLPWSIRLAARPVSEFPSSSYHDAPLAYISVHDVISGIYLALRQHITLEEYESLAYNRQFRADVIAAYRKRKDQEMREWPGVQEFMRRIDWLAGRTTFEGLENSRVTEGMWTLRLGWGA